MVFIKILGKIELTINTLILITNSKLAILNTNSSKNLKKSIDSSYLLKSLR